MDEVYTILRASGHSIIQERNAFYEPLKITTVHDLLSLQRISESNTNTIGTIRGLAQEEPQHPPFYFLLSRWFGPLFGFSKFIMKGLPVLCGLAGIPALFWLTKELSDLALMPWLVTAFYTVSPIFIRYSHETRQYSLMLTLAILSTASLLKALRKPNMGNWGIFTLLSTISFYTQPISILTALSQVIYVLFSEKFRLTWKTLSFCISGLLAILAFSPWLYIIFNNYRTVADTTFWMDDSIPLPLRYQYLSIGLSRAFLSLHFNDNYVAYISAPFFFIGICYFFYYLIRSGNEKLSIFVLSFAGTSFLPFLIKDIMDSGVRTNIPRYFLHCYLSIYIALGFFLSSKIQFSKLKFRWLVAISVCLIIPLISSGMSSQAISWWGWSQHDIQFAQIINQSNSPLIVSDRPFNDNIAFAVVAAIAIRLATYSLMFKRLYSKLINKTLITNPERQIVLNLRNLLNLLCQPFCLLAIS